MDSIARTLSPQKDMFEEYLIKKISSMQTALPYREKHWKDH